MSHSSPLIAEDIQQYLKQHENKELLRFLTCGNVDDGKSTLIGRLLFDSKAAYEDQLAAVTRDSVKAGTTGARPDLSLLVDGLQAEREQGITIDVAYRYFSTAKRKFIIADTPGHEQYTRNMATGASNCELAIILIDARKGVQTQTRRHSFIASLLGIKHIVVAVNKMDLVEFSEARFAEIEQQYREFSRKLQVPNIHFVPISALDGDNVVELSANMPWYTSKTLLEILETAPINQEKNYRNFRLPVQYVNRPNLDFRGFCGTIAAGVVRVGDEVMALPSRTTSRVKDIVTFDGNLAEAFAGQAITLTLEDEIDVSRGDSLVHVDDLPEVAKKVTANLVWLAENALVPGKLYDFKFASQASAGSVGQIHHLVDVNTLEQHSGEQVQLNEIAQVDVVLEKNVVFDPYEKVPGTGAFIVIDRLSNVTVGAGMIIGTAANEQDNRPVSAEDKARRFNQTPAIIALTGERSAEIAQQLDRRLFEIGRVAAVVAAQHAHAFQQAGLLALVVGEVQAASLRLNVDNMTLESILNHLQELAII